MGVCFLTPKARPTATPGKGYGSVAIEPIAAGEVVAAFGGRCVTRDEFELLPASQQVRSVQIDEHLYMAGTPEPEPADFINHSCDPNCLVSGNVLLVASPRHRRRRRARLRLRDHRRQRLRRVRVLLRDRRVPGQGVGPRLDAPRAATALSRLVQPISGQAHRRLGTSRRRAPRLRPLAVSHGPPGPSRAVAGGQCAHVPSGHAGADRRRRWGRIRAGDDLRQA